jgi:hypothetical protein
VKQACELTGFIQGFSASWGMRTVKPTRRVRFQPLETGQVWRVADLNLKVGLVGKMLVHYKLAKPDAVRIQTSVSGIKVVEKYLKKNKAVLLND